MTHQTRRRTARSPAARSAATTRERPNCPPWSGAPPTAAQVHIKPLVAGALVRRRPAAGLLVVAVAATAATGEEDEEERHNHDCLHGGRYVNPLGMD